MDLSNISSVGHCWFGIQSDFEFNILSWCLFNNDYGRDFICPVKTTVCPALVVKYGWYVRQWSRTINLEVIYVNDCIMKNHKIFVLCEKVPFHAFPPVMNLVKVCFFSYILSTLYGNFIGSLMKIKNEQVSRQSLPSCHIRLNRCWWQMLETV